jgi:hypothetical protein
VRMSAEWIAGFFDGEGCIQVEPRIRGSNVGYQLSATISQNDRRPLDVLAARYGGSVSLASNGRCHRWRVHARRAERFLSDIAAHLLIKGEAVAIALEIQKTQLPKGQLHTPQSNAARRDLHAQFRKHFS